MPTAGTASGVHPGAAGLGPGLCALPGGIFVRAWMKGLGRAELRHHRADDSGRDQWRAAGNGVIQQDESKTYEVQRSRRWAERGEADCGVEILAGGPAVLPSGNCVPDACARTALPQQDADRGNCAVCQQSTWLAVRCYRNAARRPRAVRPFRADLHRRAGQPLAAEEGGGRISDQPREGQKSSETRACFRSEALAEFREALAAYEAIAEKAQ